jgi:hypothetical protein
MRYLNAILLFSAMMLFLPSCEDDHIEEPTIPTKSVMISMLPYWGGTEIGLDQTIVTNEGYRVQFTELKCYFTSLKNGSNALATSALYDFRNTGPLVGKWDKDPTKFSSLSGYLGVDELYNHSDPSQFDNNDPLNIMIANDMHWDWNPGYIFVKVEAKVDTLDDGIDQFNHFVIFHVGSDAIRQSFSWNNLTWQHLGDEQYNLNLKLDLQQFVHHPTQPLDLKTEHTSHNMAGQEVISLKIIQNFLAAISPF